MRREGGFTLVEMLVSILILSVGLLALGASTGAITRTLSGSRTATVASQVAARRLDMLRAASMSTSPACGDAGFTSSAAAVTTQGVSEEWVVPPTGSMRVVLVIVTYRLGGGRSKTDTLATNIQC